MIYGKYIKNLRDNNSHLELKKSIIKKDNKFLLNSN